MPEEASPGSDHAQALPTEPPPRSHLRARQWLTGGIVAVLALIGGALIAHFATAHRGGIVLPGRLLGTNRYTGPDANVIEHKIENEEVAASDGVLASAVAVIYGNPDGPGFTVIVGTPCSTGGPCVAPTAGHLLQILRTHGDTNARSFPQGSGGDVMVCYSRAFPSVPFSACLWVAPSTIGEVVFHSGSALSLADAAAWTTQIRAAIEH